MMMLGYLLVMMNMMPELTKDMDLGIKLGTIKI
jgi:hypothetical protein